MGSANWVLQKIFSRKISTGGHRNTVKVAGTKALGVTYKSFSSTHSANLKYICDLSDPTQPFIVIDTGNSGNVLSKYYYNLMGLSENNNLIKIKDHEFKDERLQEILKY